MFMRMKNKTKSAVKYLMGARQETLEQRFETELALIEGTHRNENPRPSILHFSFNKAGTQYIKSILSQCATQSGMTTVSIHDYAFHSTFPYLNKLTREELADYQHLFKSKGYLYSVFGGMIDGIENLQDYKTILVTRDPRDILVSEYFSFAFSHVEPSQKGDKHAAFMSQRKAAQSVSIDDYVLAESGKMTSIFSRYQAVLLDQYERAYVARYEEMVSDFSSWLEGLLAYCGFELSEAFVQGLIEQNEASKPKAEDVNRHVRKGKAGDYKEKLQPETIRQLNEDFGPMLERFGYLDF